MILQIRGALLPPLPWLSAWTATDSNAVTKNCNVWAVPKTKDSGGLRMREADITLHPGSPGVSVVAKAKAGFPVASVLLC